MRASALQLFILLILPGAVSMLTDLGRNPFGFGALVVYFMLVVFGWWYSVGMAANQRLDPDLQLNPIFLRIAVVVPFVYLALFIFLYVIPLYNGVVQRPPSGFVILHFASIFCGAYCIWFCAKQFTTLRQGRETGFIDYYPAFMGFWISFVGVWFIQPRVIESFRETLPDNQGG